MAGKARTKRNVAKGKTCALQLGTKSETGESFAKGQKRDEIECAGGALDLKNRVER